MGEAARKLEGIQLQHQERRQITLLELVAAVADSARTENEVIATVAHMINSKQIELVGNFCGRDVRVG